ncbi:zinc finger protein 239 isoform X2 [Ixodes scapularis]|uniref:zinc finger protein 239 isoform X2 n=1 Tax=Ixodes scapularis TaxID=6945 RepID=UPI001A9DE2B0|nr:zinc finger protein 239 isoform X2 [Ixodes scapularis]
MLVFTLHATELTSQDTKGCTWDKEYIKVHHICRLWQPLQDAGNGTLLLCRQRPSRWPTQLLGTWILLPEEAAFQDDGNSESDFSSPRNELIESQPTTRPRYEGMYHCEFCPYSSPYQISVTRHERTHTGKKPFRCSVCERAFAQMTHLQGHMRTHTGEKPFSCEVCQKAFTRSHDLKIHKRAHTGERPYQCGKCEKQFSKRVRLLCHERAHNGERPYKCEACGKTFAQISNLSRHKKVHK